jgi:hypothetical protein
VGITIIVVIENTQNKVESEKTIYLILYFDNFTGTKARA